MIWRKNLTRKIIFGSFHFIVKMKSLNNFKDKTWIKVLQTTTKDTCSFREQIVN